MTTRDPSPSQTDATQDGADREGSAFPGAPWIPTSEDGGGRAVLVGMPLIGGGELARLFHEAYERLALDFGYKTREASAVPWEDVPDDNKRLMTATAGAVLDTLHPALQFLLSQARAGVESGERERIAAALLAVDPVEWALAGAHAGSDAAQIARRGGQ